jgi:hypothetical protein
LIQVRTLLLTLVVRSGPPEALPETVLTVMSAAFMPLAVSASRRSVEWMTGTVSPLEWTRYMGASSGPEAWALAAESVQRAQQVVSALSG